MGSKISNRGNSQAPNDQTSSAEEYDLSGDFDARAEDDGGIILGHEPQNINQSIKNLMRSIREKISNWLQPVRDFLERKFSGSQSSRALMNIRQDSVPLNKNIENKSVGFHQISIEIVNGSPENFDSRDSNGEKITSENIQSNQKNLESFKEFRKNYEKYKNRRLDSLDNFKTEHAKRYARTLIEKSEENVKNDPNYFFKHIAEYKDVAAAAAVLDEKNKFALNVPKKDEESNFQLWVRSNDPIALAKLRASEDGLRVDLQKAKIYADWVVFQNLIGELPESVNQSTILLATKLRNIMESAKVEASIDSLNHEVNKITGDLMAVFEEATSDKVTPLSPSANDQRPVTSVKPASVPELTPKSLVSSDPPPPPPPRLLKATSDAAKTNADVLTDIAQSTPPPAPPPRVRKSSEEIQQKPNDAAVTLRSVAEPDVERNNLSLSQCVDVFKNLSRSDQTDLRKLLAPGMALSDFRSLVNQSSLFFTDTVNVRPIDKDRQADVYKLSGLWDSAKKTPLASNDLSQLRFFRELDYLMNMLKRPN